jgi:hypothetical protein
MSATRAHALSSFGCVQRWLGEDERCCLFFKVRRDLIRPL